jgi:hypothetical protein
MADPPHSLVLVVDADIARAAGPDPKDSPWPESSKACHDLLEAVRQGGYRVVFDRRLKSEWDEHAGRTATQWLANMVASRRVVKISGDADTGWVAAMIDSGLPVNDRPAARKDSHLVALADDPGDGRIFSNDRKARAKFAAIPEQRIAIIHWAAASAETAEWLSHDAPDKPEWTLGGVEQKQANE